MGRGDAAPRQVRHPRAVGARPAAHPRPPVARPRIDLAIHGIVAFVTLWLHVELAVLLSAGVGFFELFGNQLDPLARRIQRVAALGVGVAVGVVSEFAYYAAHGVGLSMVNSYVFGGQTSGFPQQYGWSMTGPSSPVAALFPLLVMAPFVPVLWRRAAPETRLAACLSVATAIVAIRRHDPQHLAAVSTLFVFTGALLADDVHRARKRVELPRRGAALGLIAGAAWAGALLFAAFELESLLSGAILMFGVALAVVVGYRGDWPWASAGALSRPAGGALWWARGSHCATRCHQRTPTPRSAPMPRPSPPRSTGASETTGGPSIANTQLSPRTTSSASRTRRRTCSSTTTSPATRPDLVDDMRAGDVPAFIQTYPLREWMHEVGDRARQSSYVPCSRVAVPATGNTITIWVGADHAPAEQRSLRAGPDGTLTPVGLDRLADLPAHLAVGVGGRVARHARLDRRSAPASPN